MSEFNPSPEFEEKVRRAVAVPDADPEFVRKLQTELARRPVKIKKRPRFVLKPAWAFAIALVAIAVIAATPAAVNALKKLLGYVPNVGLVENTGNLRMLAKPVSVTRDGVTLTISSVFVYEDHVELIYDVQGVSAENNGWDPANSSENPKLFCGGVVPGDSPPKEGNAVLRLPDGTVLERDGTGKYPQDQFAMKPVYETKVPEDVTGMTLLLDCIPEARRGAVPENWEVPFRLIRVPEGTVVGNPVIDVNATSEPVATATVSSTTSSSVFQVTFTLDRVAQTENGPVFYIHMNVANPPSGLVTVFPRDVYAVDSRGHKIQLMNNTPYSDDPSTVWEYASTERPADGPLTLVVADAVAKYSSPKGTSFSFDAGENPYPGQTWAFHQEVDVAGYKFELNLIRAITFDDIKDNPEIWDPQGKPDYPEGSQGFDHGYQFTYRLDPSLGILGVGTEIQSDQCGLTDVRPMAPTVVIYDNQLCRAGYPKGTVSVSIHDLTVLLKNIGQVTWAPEITSAPATSATMTAAPVPSLPVTIKVERIVPLEAGTLYYISMNVENPDPSLISVMPVRAYLLDSLGQKIELRGGYVWQPFEHRLGSPFEFLASTKPADGPVTVVVDQAVATYAPLYTDPPQATPDEMSFTFNVGENPQPGQTWELNKDFNIAGYPVTVQAARATTYEEINSKNPDMFDSQGFTYGYDFLVDGNPSTKMQVDMDIITETPICMPMNMLTLEPNTSTHHYTILCRDAYPKGDVRVNIRELSVAVENTWQAVLNP
jgi:hypothetical protein